MSQFAQQWPVAQQEQMMHRHGITRPIYPFSALVGQEEMKLALLLNAIAPQIGGVLVRGEKGTAKSTAVRALQALLPDNEVVAGCAFGCNPADLSSLCYSCLERLRQEGTLMQERRAVRLVELPLGATEDRVLGTLDLERAIKDGIRSFEPGLLALAHRGILYIDEVNLLPDHLVDALLDAAVTGINVVEREGISFVHPASFLLIGTMNPEEGDLRPQLLDRFGLSVEVRGLKDAMLRAEVVKRRIAFEADASTFAAHWRDAEDALRSQIKAARRLLTQVSVPEHILGLITHICANLDVEGLRADLTIYKSAAALAALEQRTLVTEQDVERVAPLALAHRQRRQPHEQPGLDTQTLQHVMQTYFPPQKEHQQQKPEKIQQDIQNQQGSSSSEEGGEKQEQALVPHENSPPTEQGHQQERELSEQVIPPGVPTTLAPLEQRNRRSYTTTRSLQRGTRRTGGRTITTSRARGRTVAARRPAQRPHALALAPTLRRAALQQPRRRREHAEDEQQRFWLERWDILEPVREQKCGVLMLFVVDASGSMAARQRMAAAKGAVLALLQRAYQRRDRVGLLQFRGSGATLLLAPTNSTSRAFQALAQLPTGGRTPLASALRLAQRTLQKAMARESQQQPILICVTDGRANVVDNSTLHAPTVTPVEDALEAARELRAMGITSLVIDTETGFVRTELAALLARQLGGSYVALTSLEASSIVNAVQTVVEQELVGKRPSMFS
jgi:magnesium chelatase subunit D